jgi:CcmD family protein
MQRISTLALLAISVLLPLGSNAQEKVDMADTMRSNGKIYVIVAIILIVLIGLFAYLFSVDRKISKLEKKLEGGAKPK